MNNITLKHQPQTTGNFFMRPKYKDVLFILIAISFPKLYQAAENEPLVSLKMTKNNMSINSKQEACDIFVYGANGANASNPRIEIKRVSGGGWFSNGWSVLHQGEKFAWKAKIAGKFLLRGVVNSKKGQVYSPEYPFEIKFPSYTMMENAGALRTYVNLLWANTLADATESGRRERGGWIRLDTTKSDFAWYDIKEVTPGDWISGGVGGSISLGTRPKDEPADPKPEADGAVYYVASIHTHTTMFYLSKLYYREVGPSGPDNTNSDSRKTPGIVYDYQSVTKDGFIWGGTPKESPAQYYLSGSYDRRETPP